MRIGIFDSGVGGITVLNEALKVLPCADYIYYADTENVPYGEKNKEEVKEYIFQAVEFIANQMVDALVIACNTATSIAVKELRRIYKFPIIGMEPAVKPAIERSGSKRVLVTATALTLKEEKFHNLVDRLDSKDIVDSLPLPELVEFAEGFIFDEGVIIPYLKEKLYQYDMSKYGTLVLGCTHFPFYKKFFQKIVPSHVDVIDGNEGTVNHLKNILTGEEITNTCGHRNITFYSSGKEVNNVYEKYLEIL